PGAPVITGSRGAKVDGEPVRYVQVRWDDAGSSSSTTELTVVPEGGTKVCGTRPAE
ncbi:MAG: uncharacterized protein JWR41_2598, partial [Modestobacter sp.]|nr:uncharacterized protein [Modestobacter sp.]